MQKLVFATLACAVAVGFLAPRSEPAAPPAANVAPEPEPAPFAPAPRETELLRRPDGHFHVTAQVNGAPISFVVDTGASAIALTEADARAAGLAFSPGEFRPIARTAGGMARGEALTLDRVTIEGKEVADVRAVVIEGLPMSLLGQSYLARIGGVEMNGDRMILR